MSYKLLFTLLSLLKILKTPIFHFLPQLKLHHVVLIKNGSIYAVDFTPINQTEFTTLKRLFLGKNVPAEIRVVPIHYASFENEEEIISEWVKMREKPKKQIEPHILSFFENWENKTMNLYFHNCQHFSRFIMDKTL